MSKAKPLHEDLLVLFERACREREFELADLLLTALEGIARQRGDNEQLALAYLIFAKACGSLETQFESVHASNDGGLKVSPED